MPAAVALMLGGHALAAGSASAPGRRAGGGWAGSTVVAEYAGTDLAMRNMVIVTLRRVGFPGWRVAEVFGLTADICGPAEDGGGAGWRGGAGRPGQAGPAAGAGGGQVGPGAAVA